MDTTNIVEFLAEALHPSSPGDPTWGDRLSQALDSLRGKKLLLAASTGGHLSQLHRLAELMEPADDSLWVTFDKPQSRSMLADQRHRFIPYIAPRDARRVLSGAKTFREILAEEEFDAVVSTGAAIALSSHLVAQHHGLRTIYIESVSRFDGPSLTGRILQRVPRIERYCQHPGYDARKWKQEFSVLDAYASDPTWKPTQPPRSIFVTLGTIHPYRFDRLVDKLVSVAPPETRFTWQLGSTARTDLPGDVHIEMSSTAFEAAASESDLVITHAGVGTIMGLLDMRRPTLVVPRRRGYREHVDDHQLQITREVSQRGLAVAAEVDQIGTGTLAAALAKKVL
ncbi:glycosyltransferase [Herbiconiux sp. VKM Ac-2851]|uniref:glycosyltransferase n=1 Tax=Herbiconiux sp. VKM Ac-2851 TaxID=2739025 RepID=UPI001565E0EB|nr:glycosyltransferase [Herbiconiux sp. VKM Ac-2851]NQX35575.1 glycosyltransferase [Herbiconiux sp. VKM Ac-2851]